MLPEAPIYVVEGAPGNENYFKDDKYPYNSWTIKMLGVESFGLISSSNATHLEYYHMDSKTKEPSD